MIYGQGISREGELIDLAVKFEIVQKSGSWFSYKEERLCQGRDKLKDYLREHRELAAEIEVSCGRNFKGRLPPPGPRGGTRAGGDPPGSGRQVYLLGRQEQN